MVGSIVDWGGSRGGATHKRGRKYIWRKDMQAPPKSYMSKKFYYDIQK